MRRSVPIARLEGVLNTERGLTGAEAGERLRRYGRNNILETRRLSWLVLVKDTAGDPMLWFLLATGVLFLFLGDRVEAVTLLAAAVPLVGMDLYLHRRTRASTEGLATRLAARAVVRRDAATLEIPATDVVPGDLVLISAGQSFPADGILIKGEAIQVDESTLTGEAYPVSKQALASLDPIAPEVRVDTAHWVHAGTRMLTGNGRVRIVHTGAETLYGEIVRSAAQGSRARTPLQSAIGNLVGVLILAAVVLCVVLAWVRWRQGFGLVDAVVSALTLAIAALPEEFPVVFTVFLGVGIYRLAQRRALVQRAVAVENIGRVSCVCADKTGTITEGRLHLAHAYPRDGLTGERLRALAALASRRESGDPMDVAILQAVPGGSEGLAPLATFPFTEDRKRETIVWRRPDGSLLAATKGAPERVLAMCALGAQGRAAWEAKVAELAASGHKVIGCAARELAESGWVGGEPDRALDFAGLLAFEDPVRESVPEAVAACRDAGIHIIMITGDHPVTAAAVAREIGLGAGEPNVIEAESLDALAPCGAGLKTVDVIARAVPSQKVDVVRALQAAGEIVAVTGDGVNDVPALQAADIGLAMGERGTRSARDVAAIVLLDENFRTIIRAIVEGRQLFRNLKLSFAYLLMIHIPLVTTAALIPLAGFPLLYLPIHIVWMELVIHPTALLVFQELPPSARLHPEIKSDRPRFFDRREWLVIAAAGVAVTLMIVAGYDRSLGTGGDVEHARAMTLAMLSFASAMLMSILSGLRTVMSWIIAGTTIAAAFVLVQTPALAGLLHLAPLHADDWLLVLAGAAAIAAIAALGRFRDGGSWRASSSSP